MGELTKGKGKEQAKVRELSTVLRQPILLAHSNTGQGCLGWSSFLLEFQQVAIYFIVHIRVVFLLTQV
jgi:hypothetical protein